MSAVLQSDGRPGESGEGPQSMYPIPTSSTICSGESGESGLEPEALAASDPAATVWAAENLWAL